MVLRHQAGTQEAPTGTQEAPSKEAFRRHPGGIRETLRGPQKTPRDTQEAARGPERSWRENVQKTLRFNNFSLKSNGFSSEWRRWVSPSPQPAKVSGRGVAADPPTHPASQKTNGQSPSSVALFGELKPHRCRNDVATASQGDRSWGASNIAYHCRGSLAGSDTILTDSGQC